MHIPLVEYFCIPAMRFQRAQQLQNYLPHIKLFNCAQNLSEYFVSGVMEFFITPPARKVQMCICINNMQM